MLRRLPALLALLLPLAAAAQSPFGFEYRPNLLPPVLVGSDTLHLAWAGGLNSPQYSSIDLNADGNNDLFVFERMTNRVLTFLSVPAPTGGRRWQYAPSYESIFPADLDRWALLRDYDCDGRPDLWAFAGTGDVRVYRNVAGPGGRPTFQQASPQLAFYNTTTFNGTIYLGSYDIPAIQDVDGDGKLDIIAFDFGFGTQVQYYRNVSTSCGGLQYRYESLNWGGITFCGSTCTDYSMAGTACRPTGINHTGGFGLLLQDFDNDGDQDLLLGRDSCPEMVAIRNSGTAAVANTNNSSLLRTLPNGLGVVDLVNYPVPYAIDANQDGKQDIVVASGLANNDDLTTMRRNGAMFFNTGTNAAPNYVRQSGPFLQDQMIDVSEGAATAFGDIDGDGLVDMLVANTADQYAGPLSSGTYRATLSYYRNIGTAQRPAYRLVTNDYLNLSALSLQSLRPALTDLNRDGALDLVFGSYYIGANFLFYYLNTAAAGQPASFNTSQLNNLNNLGNTRGDTPCFTDVDGDGYLDLLIGTNTGHRLTGGSLRYYRRNPSQPLNDAFTLVNDNFGGFRTPDNQRPMNLTPAVADVDGDGTPDLLVLEHTGTLHLVTNYRAQSGIFTERTEVMRNPATGQMEAPRWGNTVSVDRSRNHLNLVDLNGDNAPELVVGTEAGGLMLYGTVGRITSTRRQAADALPLQVYPNPAQQQVTVESATPARVLLRDLLGRVVQQHDALLRRQQLNVETLPAGVYLLEATDANGRRGVQRLQVK
ncbi:T9SS type A sorting domain-containing protein [Hymenobacter gummosus]|uniref:T9SS type A sorting domain-containing protein n=1 Tax=Hymenobacter gummosus TaxID=1776032 RepID=A0A431U2Q5_9BACT|nr:FG-GAP-like repeat-containing protein [Hymenobacter gummosus]RTQ49662.1 T9SS type A sorting domain-containing protein [Hymenobacter gummosus]